MINRFSTFINSVLNTLSRCTNCLSIGTTRYYPFPTSVYLLKHKWEFLKWEPSYVMRRDGNGAVRVWTCRMGRVDFLKEIFLQVARWMQVSFSPTVSSLTLMNLFFKLLNLVIIQSFFIVIWIILRGCLSFLNAMVYHKKIETWVLHLLSMIIEFLFLTFLGVSVDCIFSLKVLFWSATA